MVVENGFFSDPAIIYVVDLAFGINSFLVIYIAYIIGIKLKLKTKLLSLVFNSV